MVTETPPDQPVPESAFADYEQDLIQEGVPPAQARASRRALERIVDRFTAHLATKADLRELRNEVRAEIQQLRTEFQDLRSEFQDLRTEVRAEIQDLRADHGAKILKLIEDVAALKAEMRTLRWVLAIGMSGVFSMLTAILVVLLTRL